MNKSNRAKRFKITGRRLITEHASWGTIVDPSDNEEYYIRSGSYQRKDITSILDKAKRSYVLQIGSDQGNRELIVDPDKTYYVIR